MSIFSTMDVTASGLTVQRLRMDVISQNVANVNTTRTESGDPYKRKVILVEEATPSFQEVLQSQMTNQPTTSGVKATAIVEDSRPFVKVYDPGHPDANAEGYVNMPNVNIIEEMTNMISASRAYEANVTVLNGTKGMAMKALEIGK